MGIYRGTDPLKAYKGDMQPVNVYKGSTKVAGWHSASYSGTSPLTVDCDYDVPPDALVIDGKCVQTTQPHSANYLATPDGVATSSGITVTVSNGLITITGTATADVWFRLYPTVATPLSINISQVMPLPMTSIFAFTTISGNHTGTVAEIIKDDILGTAATATAAGVNSSALTKYTRAWIFISSGSVFNNYSIKLQINSGTAKLEWDAFQYASPSPDLPAPISTITGNVTITGADGAASDTATVAFGSAACASLPDGTHDSYDAVTGVLTKRVGKFIGSSGTSWTISDAATSASFMSDRISAGTMSAQNVTASAACAPTIYYALATPTTVQLVPHLPVVRTGIKTLSVGADVVPTISATVKSMD